MRTIAKHVTYSPPLRGGMPDSWKQAAGILRGKRPNPIKELVVMRAEWERRMKGFEKRSRA